MEVQPEASVALPGRLSPSLSTGLVGTEKERWSFYYFQQHTAPQISAFFGGDFWHTLLLQAALHEPSIRDAILALGSLHAISMQDRGVHIHAIGCADDFALARYSRAIKGLVEPLAKVGRQAIDTFLICSILFACFETIAGSYGSAITHVRSGMQILSTVKYDENASRYDHDILKVPRIPYAPVQLLEHMFMRLDIQVTEMINGQRLETSGQTKNATHERDIPAPFSKLAKARDALVANWLVVSYNTGVYDPPAIPQTEAWQKRSASVMARWSGAYDVCQNIHRNDLTGRRRKGTAALIILKELGSTAEGFSQSTVHDERDWDVLTSMFEKIVLLAGEIIDIDLRTAADRYSTDMNMAIIGLLFKVVCRCRDPLIRRKAIWVIRKSDRTEGAWNALATSIVAQRIVDIEEAGLKDLKGCEDVPGWARIANVTPVFNLPERKAVLTYSRPTFQLDRSWQKVEEMIEW